MMLEAAYPGSFSLIQRIQRHGDIGQFGGKALSVNFVAVGNGRRRKSAHANRRHHIPEPGVQCRLTFTLQ
jgi:hypothetical protein